MWVRERRLRFENLEQRKQFAGDGFAEPIPTFADANTYSESQDAQGVRAAEVRIQFDPLSVQPDLNSIKAGDAWNGKASVVANVDEAAGTLVAFLFTTLPITGQGNLLELEFRSAGSVPIDASSPPIGIETVRLNEGAIAVTSDLTVLATPPQASRNATRDAIEDAHTEPPTPSDQAADDDELKFVLDDLLTIEDRNQSPVACDRLDDAPASGRREPDNRLHDMSVTGVFIGPVLPDFLGG